MIDTVCAYADLGSRTEAHITRVMSKRPPLLSQPQGTFSFGDRSNISTWKILVPFSTWMIGHEIVGKGD